VSGAGQCSNSRFFISIHRLLWNRARSQACDYGRLLDLRWNLNHFSFDLIVRSSTFDQLLERCDLFVIVSAFVTETESNVFYD
jgi:hypothetical protein